MLQEEPIRKQISELASAQLVMLYSISRYHEKYRFTQWVLEELITRDFTEFDIQAFDNNFSEFYNSLLNSTTL